MAWDTPHLQDLFGRVTCGALNLTQCAWENADGTHCQTAVTKASRKNGAICLKEELHRLQSTCSAASVSGIVIVLGSAPNAGSIYWPTSLIASKMIRCRK